MIKQRKHEFDKFQLEKNSNHKHGEACYCYACYASAFARATELSREDGNKIRLMIASRSVKGAPKVECWRHNIACVFFAGTSPVCPSYCSRFGEPDPVEPEPQLDVETTNEVVLPDGFNPNQRDILHDVHVLEPGRVFPQLSDVVMIKREAPAIEIHQEALCFLDSVDGEQMVSMSEDNLILTSGNLMSSSANPSSGSTSASITSFLHQSDVSASSISSSSTSACSTFAGSISASSTSASSTLASSTFASLISANVISASPIFTSSPSFNATVTTTATMSIFSFGLPESDGDAVDKVFEQTFLKYADSMVRCLNEHQFLPLYRIFVDRLPRISCSFRGSVDCLHFTKCDCRVHLVVCAPYPYEGHLYLFRKRQSMIELLSDILYKHSDKAYDDVELEVKRGLLQEESSNQMFMGSFVNRLSLYLHYYVERLDPQEFQLVQFLFIVKDIVHHFDVFSCVTAGCDHKDECCCHLKLRGRENLVPYVGLIYYHNLDHSIGKTIIELSSRFTVRGSHIVVLDGDDKEWDKKFCCHDPVISFVSYFEAFRKEECRVRVIVPSMRSFDVDDAGVRQKKKKNRPRRKQIAANEEWEERTLKAQISSSVSYTQQH